ncbi:MAG: cysteine desulfurase [Magnetococcus sp. YQC-3]
MIYLDYNATSPMPPQVLAGMLPFFAERVGNPSSVHGPGRLARQGLDEARRQLASRLQVHESQVIFTSGGTEANNIALFGTASRCGFRGHMVVSAVEHPSVLQVGERLAQLGMEVTWLAVDEAGVVRPDALRAAMRADTVLVSIMHANNETGVIQPLAEIATLCRAMAAKVAIHTDAVQSGGRVPLSLAALQVDMLSLSAHKLGGPKGVGALIVDKSLALEPLLLGGGQERGRRAGTENVPGIVGFGLAFDWACARMGEESARLLALQQQLERGIQAQLPACQIFGQQAAARLPNTTALGMPGIHGETVVMNLDLEGFAVSSGSACGSGRAKPSHVPLAMGASPDLAAGMVRVALGWETTQEEVERFVVAFVRVIKRLQQFAFPALPGEAAIG